MPAIEQKDKTRIAPVVTADAQSAHVMKEHMRVLEELSSGQRELASYTNLIVFGGYATFFALWQISRHLLTPAESVSILLYMIASATIFVFFEVGRVAVISWSHTLHTHVLLGAHPTMHPEQRKKAINEAIRKGQALNVRFYSYIWPLTSLLTISLATVAIVKLALALVQALDGAPTALGV